MKKFDVIVVGAGTAGCMTAKVAASAGLEVCLIDRKKNGDIGEKVCGDAVGKHHFDELNLTYPKGDELRNRIVGIKIYSPDKETVFEVKSERLYGFILNRHLFGQRLLQEALDSGATLLDSTIVTKPILYNGFVTGIIAKDLKMGNTNQLESKVVVDASGFATVLRKKLPLEIGIDSNVNNEDVEACYREIRSLNRFNSNSEFCEIYLDLNVAPGGYYWIFPEGEDRVNVGLGVAMTESFPNPKNKLYQNVLSQSRFKESKIITGGAWYVPTRRPLDCMVGNGIVIVGDAACQVNPIHGGGIGPSLTGGKFTGETVIASLDKDDVSRKGLWQYNFKYMCSYGAKQAGLDIFRLFLLQTVNNEDLNYGLKYRLITEDDLLKVSQGEDLRLHITEKTRRALRGLGKLSLLWKLRDTANLLKEIKALYFHYPTLPEGFVEWTKKSHGIMEKAKKRLSRE